MSWLWAGMGGIVAGAAVLALFVVRKKGELQQRAQALQVAAQTGVGKGQLAQDAVRLQAHLRDYAEEQGRVIGRQAAEQVIAKRYGLTADRIAKISRLAGALA